MSYIAHTETQNVQCYLVYRVMRLAAVGLSLGLFLPGSVLARPAALAPPAENGSGAGSATAPSVAAFTLSDGVVIGASVSAGAEVSLPGFSPAVIDGHCNLADVLGAMLGETSPLPDASNPRKTRINALAPASYASLQFFMSPDMMGESQLASVKKSSPPPKLVFAIDYLFWHAYGSGMTDDDRRKLFDKGLERLASLPHASTIVVADLPDMTHAIGLMLSKEMVPSVKLQEELNGRLKEWASNKEHDNIVLFSLREVVSNSWAGKPITLGGRSYDGESARGLLTNSGLHATCEGLIAVAQETMQQLKKKGVVAESVKWETDPAVITQRLVELKKARDEAKKAAAPKPVQPTATAPAPTK